MKTTLIRSLLLAGLLATGLSRGAAQTPASRAAVRAKIAPALLALLDTPARGAAPAAYRIQVQDDAAFRRWARQHLPQARLQAHRPDLLTVHGVTDVAALAAAPGVLFVDVADRRARPEKEIDGVDYGANRIWSVHSRYPNLNGQGLTASVKEEPFDPNDIDFRGRVVSSPLFSNPPSDHATIMATFIGGAGNSAPTGRGAAQQVRLATSSYAQLLPDDGAQLAAAGVSVQNHSYGVAAVENYYGLEARAYDQQTRQYPTLLHVFSSGNQGNRTSSTGTYASVTGVANLTGQFKQSKNTLSVGATDALGRVAPLSSRGPAYDGRIKPEVVALGEAGTSDAAALVSGTAVLAQQAYREQAGTLPPAALVKAALINSADDIGRTGPDFESGFGQLDALGAVATLVESRYVVDAVADGGLRRTPLVVPAGLRQLKLTLVWADAEALANAGQALINDLDLVLITPGGQRYQPWVLSAAPRLDSLTRLARRGADRLNNVEQITLAAPAAGAYQLEVRGFRVGGGSPQAYAVAYEFETAGLDWSNPAGTSTALRTDQLQRLRWQWRGAAAQGRLEYRLDNGAWQLINGSVNLADGIFAWTPPDVAAPAQVRLTVGSTAYPSPVFALSRPPQLEVGYYCPRDPAGPASSGEALLAWPPVPGAVRYEVSRLGTVLLEPFNTTADTAFLLTGAQLDTRYYAVTPVLANDGRAVRSRTIDLTSSGTDCYIRSFLPTQNVAAPVAFELRLGTTFRLAQIYLERETPNGFVTVQRITPGRQPVFLLTDEPPTPGQYRYRARLETQGGRNIYTRVEAVYFAKPGQILVFPNPVPAGQNATLLDAEQRPLHWQLYDHLGRLIREADTEEGVVGEVSLTSLRAGMYVLRVRPTAGGATVVHRLLVQ